MSQSNGSKDAPEILTFEDGTHGIKMKDGSYQVFVVDKKGVPVTPQYVLHTLMHCTYYKAML